MSDQVTEEASRGGDRGRGHEHEAGSIAPKDPPVTDEASRGGTHRRDEPAADEEAKRHK